MLTNTETKAYLKRIGIADIQPPTKSYLFELHRAHVERIPWQTLDIFAGRPSSIDVGASVQLILSGRSGYCFHLNGAFSELLRSLGYKVFWHRAGVQPHGEEPRVNSFHIGLTVLLEHERWIIDAGLGDMPYEPLPLREGEYRQGPFVYQVTASGVAENGWRLVHDPLGASAGVDVAPEIVTDMGAFAPQHEAYSRSPDSPWVRLFLIRHRHASGSNELRGCIWSRREADGIVKTEVSAKSQWFDVLADIFGERLAAYSRPERDELWSKVQRQHEAWKQAMLARE